MSGFSAPPEEMETTIFKRWLQTLARKFWTVPQYSADPTTPGPEDMWVRYSGGVYDLSYRTREGTTKRVTLS